MTTEYKVVPAPERATKQRGLKGAALFAHSVEALMNELAAEGWQYLRADTLPQEERSGLTNKTTTYRNLLIFQRVVADGDTPEPTSAVPASAQTEAGATDGEAGKDNTGKDNIGNDDTGDSESGTGEGDDDDVITNLWQPAEKTPKP